MTARLGPLSFAALAFDLDGTLLARDDTVSPRNQAAVRAAMAAGYRIIVASARWLTIAKHVAHTLGLDTPIVACSGAQVYSQREHRDLLDLRLPEAFAAAIYEICDANRCVATIGVDESALLKLDGTPDPATLPAGMTFTPRLTGVATTRPRIVMVQGTAVGVLIRAELEPQWRDRVHFMESMTSQGKSNLTITAAGADKGVALGVACEELRISPRQVVAFGDAENDIEMFRVAGASVAMGQAAEHVKAHATFVSAHGYQDGVAVAIERLLETGSLA
jgi:hypothetical protein